MKTKKSTNLIAGVDNLLFDTRKFDPSQNDIENICQFFSIGKLKNYEKEKGINVSHSNFFIFVETSLGQYALKFYPADAAKTITNEYAINRFLINHRFPTPTMYASKNGQPFLMSNGRLATCFAYINGSQAWQGINKQNAIHQINKTMLFLKEVLSLTKGRIPFQKQASFTIMVKALTQESKAIAPFADKKMIDASLREACQSYQNHQQLFTRQWLHNNASLTNFLINKKTVYTLDLSHIWEDYALSDLASLAISSLFLNVPNKTINNIICDYFAQHQIGPKHLPILKSLISIGLIKEYLKNIQREQSIVPSTYSPTLTKKFFLLLTSRKKLIITSLSNLTTILPYANKL